MCIPCNSTPHNAKSRNSTPVHPPFACPALWPLQSMERDDSLSADEQDDQSELREKLRIVKTVLEQAAFNGINRKVGEGGGEEQGGREEQSLVPEQRHAHICSGTKPCRHPP